MDTFTLVLEDNREKLLSVIEKYALSGHQHFTGEAGMVEFVKSMPASWRFVLYLDNDLQPGCGSGLGFLEWMLGERRSQIERVITISFSPDARREMFRMCDSAGVPFEAF